MRYNYTHVLIKNKIKEGNMKYLLLTILALTSCQTLKVGDCVRELGSTTVETVTVIAPNGGIETSDISPYTNKPRLWVYDSVKATKLVPVQCNE
jgi:hypothetical protein